MSKLTIPETTGMSTDPVGNYPDRRSSNPNQATVIADFSYPLVSSILFVY